MKKYAPLLLLTFVNIIGFTLLIPVLPMIVKLYAPGEYESVFYGALLSSYALFQFIGSPFLGALSDKYGRRPLLFVSQLGTLISWAIFGMAYFVPTTLVLGLQLPIFIIGFSRIVDGITGGNISVAQAWIADVAPPEEKTKAFGAMGATFGLGFLIGPAIGGLTASSQYGYAGTAAVAFLISLVTLLVIYFMLPESLAEKDRDKELEFSFWNEINFWKKIMQFRQSEGVFRVLLYRLFFALVLSSFVTIFILYMDHQLGLSPQMLGLTLSSIGLFSVFNQVVVTHRVVKKYGPMKTVYMAFFLVAVGSCSIPLIPMNLYFSSISMTIVLFTICSFLINLGISLANPAFKTLLTNKVSPKQQGVINGVDESIVAIGNATMPIVAGWLYTLVGAYVFFTNIVLLLMPISILWLRKRGLLIRRT
ncbi:MAG: MFS transporter [Microgenomates group bacterium]